jgi:hypothetical protein
MAPWVKRAVRVARGHAVHTPVHTSKSCAVRPGPICTHVLTDETEVDYDTTIT